MQNADIGQVASEGGASFQDGALRVLGSGQGILQAGDSFHYVWQVNTGNFVVASKISPGADSEGAIVVRETEAPTSAALWIGFSRSGKINVVVRAGTNGVPSRTEFDADGGDPIWIKVARSGNSFDLASSEDGASWNTFHQVSLTLPAQTTTGYAVSGTNGEVIFEGAAIVANVEPVEGGAQPDLVANQSTAGGSVEIASVSEEAESDSSMPPANEPASQSDLQSNPRADGVRTLYVNKALGNDANDGLAALKSGARGPKKTIQAAMELAQDGDTIVIAGGTYEIGEAFSGATNRSITIRPVGDVIF